MVTTRRSHTDRDTSHPAAEETVVAAQPRDEDIARKAYELYERRGAEDGRDWDDWFQAEQELRQSADAVSRQHQGA